MIRHKAVVCCICHLTNTNKTGVTVFVIAIPEARGAFATSSRLVGKSLCNQLDSSRSVLNEYEIKMLGIGVEESKCSEPDRLYTLR